MSLVDYKVSRLTKGNIELVLSGSMDQEFWNNLIKEKDLCIPTFVESTVSFGMVSIQNFEIVAGAYNEVPSPVEVLRDLLTQEELKVTISYNFMLPFYGLDVVIGSKDEFKQSRISEHDTFILPSDVSNLTLMNKVKKTDGVHLMSNTRFMEVMTKLRHTIAGKAKVLVTDDYPTADEFVNHVNITWLGCPSESSRAGVTDHTKLRTKVNAIQKGKALSGRNIAHILDEVRVYTENTCNNQVAISRARNYTGIPWTRTQKATADVRTKLRQVNHYERWKAWQHFTSYVEVNRAEEITFGLLTT